MNKYQETLNTLRLSLACLDLPQEDKNKLFEGLEVLKELVDKETHEKVRAYEDEVRCPNCDREIDENDQFRCPYCNQLLDWDYEEEIE